MLGDQIVDHVIVIVRKCVKESVSIAVRKSVQSIIANACKITFFVGCFDCFVIGIGNSIGQHWFFHEESIMCITGRMTTSWQWQSIVIVVVVR